MSAQDILEKYGDILHVSNVISNIFRQIGEWTLNGLLFVNSIVEKVTMAILTSTDFFKYGPLKDLRHEMAPLIWGLMILTIVLIGFQLMFNKIEKRHNVVLNGLIALLFIVGGPTMMDLLNKISTNAITDLNHSGTETAGQTIVKNNLADVNYYAKKGFEVKKLPNEQRYNNISAENIKYIHFTEVVNTDGVKGEAKEALKNQLIVNDDNEIETKKLDDGWFGVGKQEYYRWDLNWAVVLISLLVTVVALIITIIKVGRIIFELGFHGIFGTIVAATDISGGQRLKKVINEIFSCYAVLFIMCLLLKIYTIFTGWVGAKDFGWAGWGTMLALLAGSWGLIDSPNLVERILGIDAGLGSGWKTLVSGPAVTKMAGGVGKGVVGGAGYVKDKVAQGVGAAQGMKAALKENIKENIPSLNKHSGGFKSGNGMLNDELLNGSKDEQASSEVGSNGNFKDNPRSKQKVPSIPGTNGGNKKKAGQRGNNSSLLSKKPSGMYSTDGLGASSNIPMPLNMNTSVVPTSASLGEQASPDAQMPGTADRNSVGEHTSQQTQKTIGDAGTGRIEGNQDSIMPESAENVIPSTDDIPGLNPERNDQIPSMYGVPGTVLKPGNITPTHNYTPIGQSRWMQNMKNAHAMGYNSAYNATNAVFKRFRSIRSMGNASRGSGFVAGGNSSMSHGGSTVSQSTSSVSNGANTTSVPVTTIKQTGRPNNSAGVSQVKNVSDNIRPTRSTGGQTSSMTRNTSNYGPAKGSDKGSVNTMSSPLKGATRNYTPFENMSKNEGETNNDQI